LKGNQVEYIIWRKRMTTRIPLPDDDELVPEIRELLSALPPLNLFRMLANAPASMKAFLEMGGSILTRSKFDPRKREIAILRIAHVTRAPYEWHHHVVLGKSVGVTDDEIEKIATDGPVISLDEEGNLLCRVADEISLDVRLSDGALSQILERYETRGATELILCCCWFNLVSRFLESTRVEIEGV
jgi:alkylhydroperoxidase family enzyme